ncbi:ImmA/IrrE family metallo-endopeptidase [Paenibacillus senegalimassiliensis]|uniref:ImmA/IrrE family metallo-endopeptidase n=1 Tax=Paenibacillus senegalimassiliensis TaxID=1737426 RepID=UPI00073E561A|nr:ImmA/IrrE family metallo-endopeptidase [Paenibacillus senegalimassiliensis]
MGYESLLIVAEKLNLYVYEARFKSNAKALLKGNMVGVNKDLTEVEKTCALAEEIAHYVTGSGDILDQFPIRNRKQELLARQYAYQCMIPFDRIIQAHKSRISGRYELSEYLGVTEEFLQVAIDRYTSKYGLYLKVDEQYTITFDPLGVIETI